MALQILLINQSNYSELRKDCIDSWFFVKESHISLISKTIYNDLSLVFIVISILLLVAMIGAIVLTLETNEITRKQGLSLQHQRNNSWT